MGEVFAGRYELVDLIGEGGMGTIWRVWDARTGRMVAAKVLRQSDAATLLRFVREQSVRIHHPHVVVPLGWAGEDERVLFTMPVVRGGSVATLVQDFGALPPLLVAELLRQLLAGLSAVHAAGIVHRDVKPANLLLDATGNARPHLYLTDFGISVDLDAPRWTETGVVSGTPGYLAPEMERSGTVSPAVDLYAAGQVALTMLLGTRPAHRTEALGRPDAVPETLWRLVGELVAPEPADRPPDAGAALSALEAPELAWTAAAIGEVEVFEHVPTSELHEPSTIVAPPAGPDTPPTTGALSAPPAAAAGAPLVPRLLAGLLVAVGLTGVLLIWSPWDTGPPADTGVSSTTTAGTATTGTPPTTPTTPTNAVSTSSTQGTVHVGTVVSRVGQPCEFSEVGLRDATTGGVPVICTRRSDGTYAWESNT